MAAPPPRREDGRLCRCRREDSNHPERRGLPHKDIEAHRMRASCGMVTAIAAAAVVIGATYLQGRMTDRWTGRNVAAELQQSAE